MASTYRNLTNDIAEVRLMIEGALIGSLIVIAIAILLEYFGRVKDLRESAGNHQGAIR